MTDHEKNFNLSREAYDQLALALRRGDESLFERVFLSHFSDCMHYLQQHDAATQEQAYDATMDAFLSFRQQVVDEKIRYGNLRFLLTRMARQHHYKLQRKIDPVSDILGEHPELLQEEAVTFDEDTRHLLEAAWQRLSDKCRELLRQIFYLGNSMEAIARSNQGHAATVRKQKERCIKQLRKIFLLADR